MNKNALYGIIAVLVVAAGVLGYQYYEESQKTSGIEVSVGENGLSVETK